jgi:hypothetical protein
VTVLAAVLGIGARPEIAGRAGRWAASVARHVRPSIDPDQVAETSSRLASLARTALTGRAFLTSSAFASGDLLFDLLSLDLVFLALRYQPGFGPLAVAYAAANIASAIPLTPGGLGVVKVTLVAITVGFGAAADGGTGRTRLPDRELLAPADPRRHRLSPAQATARRGKPDKTCDPAGGRATWTNSAIADWSGSSSAGAGDVCKISVEAGLPGDFHRLV